MKTEFRTYQTSDKNDIIALFNSNCPKYFNPNDLNDLVDYLENYADENFKVVCIDGVILGCGGHYVKQKEQVFGIAWVMFKRHALGVSNFLTVSNLFFEHLLLNIKSESFQFDIVINTTQLLEKLFNKFGFLTEEIIKNGFGLNLDHYLMRRKWK